MSDAPDNEEPIDEPGGLVTCPVCYLAFNRMYETQHIEWHQRLNERISNASVGVFGMLAAPKVV